MKRSLFLLLGASIRPEPEKSLSRVKSNARSLTNPTFTEVRDWHKMQLRCKPTEKNSFELRGKTRSAAKSELSELGEWCEFLEEQIRVSDAARMCLHLWEMWVTAPIELLFRGDRGAGRSQRSADALVGMTALVELLFRRIKMIDSQWYFDIRQVDQSRIELYAIRFSGLED